MAVTLEGSVSLGVIRAYLNWTQEELADRAGLSRHTIAEVEQGKQIRLATALLIVQACQQAGVNVSLADLDIQVIEKAGLRYLRITSQVTPQQVADQAGISRSRLYKIEDGQFISLALAEQVMAALNSLRAEKGLKPVQLRDLEVRTLPSLSRKEALWSGS